MHAGSEQEIDKYTADMLNQPMQYLNKFMEEDFETLARYRRLECLKMATMHATPEQVATGLVYKIAGDYYNYVMGVQNAE